MYKVVIIDDEPIIVEGISKMVPWEQYGCVIAGTASDGTEGAQIIQEQKPNIIFTDINMPGEDGLSMIAGLKSEFTQLQITILTGFRDFDYAQRAIGLGVSRFLLKPSKLDEILEALSFMTGELKARGIKGDAGEPQPEEKLENAASSFIVKNAIQYIESHYNQKLTLLEVADKTYVSQWHLSKLLNKHTGQKFSDILNTIRIEEAKKLLSNPSLRIGDIAEAVGFIDLAHFSRVFKKIAGVSANEFRNHIPTDDIKET